MCTVPLQMMAANPDIVNISLCYEIHRRTDTFSTWFQIGVCLSLQSIISQSVNNSRLNVIGRIGVLAIDNNGDCQHITVDGNGCIASVGATAVTQAAPYNNSGIRVRMHEQRYYRIAVPNCELQDLVVWAICENQNAVITQGYNQLCMDWLVSCIQQITGIFSCNSVIYICSSVLEYTC